MKLVKSFNLSFAAHIYLSYAQCPKNEEEKYEMSNVPCVNVIGSIMYSIITMKSDLSYAVNFLSWFMSNSLNIIGL